MSVVMTTLVAWAVLSVPVALGLARVLHRTSVSPEPVPVGLARRTDPRAGQVEPGTFPDCA